MEMAAFEASAILKDSHSSASLSTAAALGSARLQSGIGGYFERSWEGERIFLSECIDEAKHAVSCWAELEGTTRDLPPLAGLTMTVKACFDVEGWTTSCASEVLHKAEPATRSASLVRTFRAAGATLLAQTNMTEFAYGALGVNSRFGTPRTPLDPHGERVAGGSSSGAAVAVARGYCDFSVCSDTSGSARIPAAFCGVVGFKPSRGRYPTDGMKWLSPSFDVPGLIAASVPLCRQLDRIVVAQGSGAQTGLEAQGLRFALPAWLSEFPLHDDVRSAFENCLAALRDSGIAVVERPLQVLRQSAAIAAEGRMIAAEAYHLHREHLDRSFDAYDPLVGPRLLKGAEVPAHQYLDAAQKLSEARQRFDAEISGFDGFILPTVPMLPPTLKELEDPSRYLELNAHSFSLTEFANRLDLPSISLPVGTLPVGLMLTGVRASDDRLLAIAERIGPLVSNCTI